MAEWGVVKRGNNRDLNSWKLLTPYTECQSCGKELDRVMKHQGSPKKFCGDTCRKRAARAAEKNREVEQ